VLIALYTPTTLDGAASSAGVTVLLSSLLFALPLGIWYAYSDRIASNGGLYAFVEAAAGPRLARVQAAFWIISYFLYLIYTVPYVVYDLLPAVFPGVTPYRLLLDGLLALAIVAILLSPRIVTLLMVAAIAALQAVLAIGLAGVTLLSLGIPAGSFIGHGNFVPILQGAAKTSSLYICASLPLFLGGEVRGGHRSVQRALIWAYMAVAILAIVTIFPLAAANSGLLGEEIPGAALAGSYGGQGLEVAIGLGVALSVAGLIIAEYLALSRLLAVLARRSVRLTIAGIAVAFVIGSAISLLDPLGAYRLLLKPSLIALWISQLIVVVVYPWFVARERRPNPGHIALAAGASLLILFALYTSVASSAAT
jgi:amino acid transporter